MQLSYMEMIGRQHLQHFKPEKYWRRRQAVVDRNSKVPKLIRWYWLYYIKKCDAFNNASLGTHMGYGASIASMPCFPHGLYGIIISHNTEIGSNCTIFHNVTIGEGRDGAPIIGNNVYIGANASIVGGITIGDNVRIGAGTTIYKDVPSNSTVTSNEMIIIARKADSEI